MTTLPPPDAPAVFWIDQHNQQQGPESLTTVIERIAYNQIPATTPVWWQGAANWTTFNTVPEFAAALNTRLNPEPVPAPAPTPAADPTPAAPQPESFASPSTFQDPAPFGAPSADPTPVTASELIASATPIAEPEPAAQETTRLFDATAPQEPVAEAGPVAASDFGAGDTSAPVEAITVGEDVVDAVVVDPAPAPGSLFGAPSGTAGDVIASAPTAEAPAAEAPATEAPVAESPTLEPITLAPITLGDSAPTETEATTPVAEPVAEPVVAPADATDDLDAVYNELVARAQPFVDEQTRVAGLNDTVSNLITDALSSLGHTVTSHQESNGYHVFSVAEASGATFSLAATQVPYAPTVAEAIERPIGVHADRGGRASAYLYLADYLDSPEGANELFARHLSAILHAASR